MSGWVPPRRRAAPKGHKTSIFRSTAAGTGSYLRSAFRALRGAKIFLKSLTNV